MGKCPPFSLGVELLLLMLLCNVLDLCFLGLPEGLPSGEDLYKLLTYSGCRPGEDLFRPTPSNNCGQVPVFQRSPREIAVKVKTCIGC